MSAEEPGLSAASRCMETSSLHDEGEDGEERDEEETKEPQRSSSDESEESEVEPPPASAVRRKVSFADAFGLDLVSVKEFDSRAETGPKNLDRLLGVEVREGEEYYISCLFTVPSSEVELLSLLQKTKLEVESIELLPGSTTIRGIIRVLNLAYYKTISVRTTLDGWQTHFDLLAEYLPGSSDGQTDRFIFKLILVPPFPAEGVRVEFCLRYESNNRTFWSSNGGMNYVLFCHHRGRRELRESDGEKERETEESNHKGKKSCLKARRKRSIADLKSKGMSSDVSDPESCRSEESEKERTQQKAESRSSQSPEEYCKTLVDRRNRRRAARLARVQDYFSQREPEVQLGYHPHRETTEGCLKVEMPASQLSTPMGLDTSRVLQVQNKKDMDTPPIITYHQIPLLSLDWGKSTDTPPYQHTADISGGKSVDIPETEEDSTVSSTDAWEAFLNGTDTSDTDANAVDQGCLLHIASLPSHECDTSIPGEKILSERWQDNGPSNTTEEALAYKLSGKLGITSETFNVQDLALVHSGSETHVKISFSEDMPLLKTSLHMDSTGYQNSRGGCGVTHEKCETKAGSLGTEEEVKGDINEVAHNTLTFTGIRDEPFTIGHMGTESPLERLMSMDEEKEPKLVTEDISGKEENAAQIKVSSSKSSKMLIMQVDNEEPFLNAEMISISERFIKTTEDLPSVALTITSRNAEIISMSESMLTDSTDRKALKPEGKEEAMCPNSENERIMEMAEEIPSIVVDNKVADRESEVRSTTNVTTQQKPNEADMVTLERNSKSDTCQDFSIGQEQHKTHRTTDVCIGSQTLCISSHDSDTSGPSGATECISYSECLPFSDPHKGLQSEETLPRQDPAQTKVTTSWSESSGELIVGLESEKERGNEEPFLLQDQNAGIIVTESMVLDQDKLDAWTEWSDREASEPQGKEKTTCHNQENKGLREMTDEIPSVVVDTNVADRESEVSSKIKVTTQKKTYKAEEVTLGRKSKSDTFQDLIIGQEPHKTHKTTDLCTGSPTISISSHASDTSGPLSLTESVKESEPMAFSDPHKSFEFEETLLRQAAVEVKVMTSWSTSSEELTVGLESRKQKGNKEPFQLEDQNSEIISMSESMVLDEEELDARTEWADRKASMTEGKEEIMCHKPENEKLMKMAEEIQSVAVDINLANRENEVSSTTNVTTQKVSFEADEVALGRRSMSDTCQDFIIGQEPHKTHRTTDLRTGSPTLSPLIHASDTSGPLSLTESVKDSECLLFSDPHEDFEFEETIPRQYAAQMKLRTLWSESSEEMITELESIKQGGNEEPFHLGEQNKEEISVSESIVLDKEELDGKTKWSDWKAAEQKGQEETTCHKPENERLQGMAEEIPSVVVDNNRTDSESEVSSTTSVKTQKEPYEAEEATFGRRESTVGLESGKQGGNEEPFHLKDQSSEIISMSESMVLDEDELDARTGWSDRQASKPEGKEEAIYHNSENKRLMEMTEKAACVAVEISVTDRQSDISSSTKVITQKEPYEATAQEPHKPQRTIDICACTLTLSITSHSSDTESVKDSEPLLFSDAHRSSECGETLGYPAAQDLQELQDPHSELPAPLSSMPTPTVCTVSSRLMTWWADFCSLGHISKALLYTVLFVIFITVYLHDLPIFLAIYLLSMCWWCGQGIKKREATSDSVD